MKPIGRLILAFLLVPLALYLQALPARQLPPPPQAQPSAMAEQSCCKEVADTPSCCEHQADDIDNTASNTPHQHGDDPAGANHNCPGGHCPMPCCHLVAVELWAHHWQASHLSAAGFENGSLCPAWTNHVQMPEAPPPQV